MRKLLIEALKMVATAKENPSSSGYLDELIEKYINKMAHDPQIKVALEKIAYNANTSIEEAARVYLKRILYVTEDSLRTPSKVKKLVAHFAS